MNYKKIYDKLIEKCQTRENFKGYKEHHHIIPRCMGGTDDEENIVDMTPEEHFLAHQLLVKVYPESRKLISALSKMCSNSTKNPRGNKWYGWIRRKCSENMSGENNPSAKFTNEQVIEIYHSCDNIDVLAAKYGVKRYNIITIKRKIHYRNVTQDILDLPGYCETETNLRIPIPVDLIEQIFYDTGDYAYFWEKYHATENVVRGIKRKKSFKHITSKLDEPGQVKRYKLTYDMVTEIYESTGDNAEIAKRYGIHYNTVRNIKGKCKNSRLYKIWDEF